MNDATIILIADYGSGDPAFTEVMLQLRRRLPGVTVIPQSTPPFSTLNTGFWIYQISQTPGLTNTYIYSNTAPRKEDKAAQTNNRGEKLMYAKLKNGFEIIAVNAGYCFSLVKPYIEEFAFANVAHEGSQFRSRDIFPEAVEKMIKKHADLKGDKADISLIPDYPKHAIASIDGYGNIKTTLRQSEATYKPGQQLIVTLNNKKHLTTFADGIFGIQDGELTLAPGSTGHDDKFMELVLRGGSAYHMFAKPLVETTFSIKPL